MTGMRDSLAALRPTMLLAAGPAGITTTGGTATAGPGVTTPSTGAGHVIHLGDDEVLVAGVADITRNRAATITAWVRAPRTLSRTRMIVARETGATAVMLSISARGRAEAVVSSAAGSYRESLEARGGDRLDDGAWHLVAVILAPIIFGGVEITLWVDGERAAARSISPGLFGRRPDFTLTGGVHVGRTPGGAAALSGDVGAVAMVDRVVPARELSAAWAHRPDTRRGFTGWGIPIT